MDSVARALRRGAMLAGRSTRASITMSLRQCSSPLAAGDLYRSSPRRWLPSTRAFAAGSAALGRPSGGQESGVGGEASRSSRNVNIRRLAAAVLQAQGQQGVNRLLDAAQINSLQLTCLFKVQTVLGLARPQRNLDWLWAWAKRQHQEQPRIIFNAYINRLAKLRRWDHALKLLEEMKAGPQPDVVTYSSLVAAYGKDRQWQRAGEMLEEMQAAGLEPNAITYSSLVSAYARGGQWERARKALEEMKAAGSQPDDFVYSSLISAYGASGQWKQSRAAFEEMKVAGLRPNDITYTALVIA